MIMFLVIQCVCASNEMYVLFQCNIIYEIMTVVPSHLTVGIVTFRFTSCIQTPFSFSFEMKPACMW